MNQSLDVLRFGNDRIHTGIAGFFSQNIVCVKGAQNEGDLGHDLTEHPGSFQTIHNRHGSVQHNQVRVQFLCLLNPVSSIHSFSAHHPTVGEFQDVFQRPSNGGIIVNDHDSFGRCSDHRSPVV